MLALLLSGLMSFANVQSKPFQAGAYKEDHTHGNVFIEVEQRAREICNGVTAVRVSDWQVKRIDISPAGHYGAEAHGYDVSSEFVCQ